MAARISSGLSAVRRLPRVNSLKGKRLVACVEMSSTSASSASKGGTPSAAGEALHRLPPIVARFWIWTDPTSRPAADLAQALRDAVKFSHASQIDDRAFGRRRSKRGVEIGAAAEDLAVRCRPRPQRFLQIDRPDIHCHYPPAVRCFVCIHTTPSNRKLPARNCPGNSLDKNTCGRQKIVDRRRSSDIICIQTILDPLP